MTTAARRGWDALVVVASAVFGFGLSWSTSTVAVGGAFLLFAALLRPSTVWRTRPWMQPVMAAGLLLLAVIALRTLVADGASPGAWHRVNQYHELIVAPVLFAVWQSPRARRVFFAACVAGCIFTAVRFWAVLPNEAARAALSGHRISAGFVLAIAAYLLVLRAPAGVRGWPWHATAAFFVVSIFFAIDGRTGIVVALVLAVCAAWAQAPRRWRIAAAVATPLLLGAFALLSPSVQGRIDEMQEALHSTAVPGEGDSSAIRIQLLRITTQAVREHWVSGVGYSRYGEAHREAAEHVYAGQPNGDAFLAMRWTRLGNPHDEYVLQLVGGGIGGGLLFIAWLGAGWWQAHRWRSAELAGLVLAFAVGCAFNSLLLDFLEGHAYVGLLAWLMAEHAFGRKRDAFDRILIIATRQIGDVLLTTPLVHAARQRWPEASIDVVGFAGTLGMLRGNPDVRALIETPASRSASLALLPRLARRYDLALVADVGDRAHLFGVLAARTRSGVIPQRNASNWWKRLLLDHVVVAAGDQGSRHVVEEKQQLLSPWGGNASTPQVQPPPAAAVPADIAADLRPGYVVVHAPSMWPYKQWPLAHFETLVRSLTAQGRQVVLTGSNGARDRECIAPLKDIEGVLDVSGQLDFAQLTSLLKGAALYIGPDTSVSHLAAATGVPTIAIFGPTNPVRWGPWPAKPEYAPIFVHAALTQQAGNVTVLQSTLPCVPCGRAGCEDHRQSRSDCLPDITPGRVMAEAEKLLSAGS